MTVLNRWRAGSDRRPSDQPQQESGNAAGSADTDFLEKLVWALDSLARHAEQRGHGVLTQALAKASDAAREELRSAQPPPAEIASGRMRALWRHEGRG